MVGDVGVTIAPDAAAAPVTVAPAALFVGVLLLILLIFVVDVVLLLLGTYVSGTKCGVRLDIGGRIGLVGHWYDVGATIGAAFGALLKLKLQMI